MINDNPLVSIIIPVYNSEKFLKKCLESVYLQTYKNIEVIIIDDGSIDQSGRMCDEFSEKYKHIKIIHNSNQWIGMARNCGLDNANGDFIMFLDSDDWLEYDIIAKLVEKGIKTNADIIAVGMEQNDEEGKILGRLVPDEEVMCTGRESLRMFYQDRAEGMALAYVTGRLYKRNIFEHLRFIPKIYYEDISLMPEIMIKTRLLVYLQIIGYHYTVHYDSVSHSQDNYVKLYNDSFKIWENQLEFYYRYHMKEFEKYINLLICEKVVNHDIKDSIPDIFYEESIQRMRKNFTEAMKANVSIKRKLRLCVYRILGKKAFVFLQKMG